jgi:hypothetical protein
MGPASSRAPAFQASIVAEHRNNTLCVDFFFIHGNIFLHTISRGLGFHTVAHVPNRSLSTILTELRSFIHLYSTRGYTNCNIHADAEFACVTIQFLPISTNIVPHDSHVGEVERSIRTIKERLCSCSHCLPFRRLPRLLLFNIVSNVVRLLNQFPYHNGFSEHLSPSTIFLGITLEDFLTMRIEFGHYAQVYDDPAPSNTVRSRSVGAIALDPTGNAQGDGNFFSLASRRCLSRHQWLLEGRKHLANILPVNKG